MSIVEKKEELRHHWADDLTPSVGNIPFFFSISIGENHDQDHIGRSFRRLKMISN